MLLNEMLGIKYPIIQGGMANIATGKFAAAVSEAGGLGLIASGGYDAARIEQEIAEARKATDKPFGVNLMLLNPDVDNIADLLAREYQGYHNRCGFSGKIHGSLESIGYNRNSGCCQLCTC